jgi:hypothetical protein
MGAIANGLRAGFCHWQSRSVTEMLSNGALSLSKAPAHQAQLAGAAVVQADHRSHLIGVDRRELERVMGQVMTDSKVPAQFVAGLWNRG